MHRVTADSARRHHQEDRAPRTAAAVAAAPRAPAPRTAPPTPASRTAYGFGDLHGLADALPAMFMRDGPTQCNPLAFGAAGGEEDAMSVLHDLGEFGQLQASTVADRVMVALRAACAMTPCDHIHPDARPFFDRETLNLLQQSSPGCRPAMVKVPDGCFVFAPDDGNRLLSIIKDAPMCLPIGVDHSAALPIAPNGARTVIYSFVSPPQRVTRPFKLVFHHGLLHTDEISRMSMADHAIAQVACAIPPRTGGPRVMFDSGLIGRLVSKCLLGSDADLVKRAFLGLIPQTAMDPSAVYDAPVELSNILLKLLQFKTEAPGQLALGRCRDGIFGYWRREDGRNTFIFVAGSNDFHADRPAPVAESQLHIYHVQYRDPHDNGVRVFVRIGGKTVTMTRPSSSSGATPTSASFTLFHATGTPSFVKQGEPPPVFAPGCPYNLPLIIPGQSSISDIMRILFRLFQLAALQENDCHEFPEYCAEEAAHRVRTEQPMDDVVLRATEELLYSKPELAPESSYAGPPSAESNNAQNAAQLLQGGPQGQQYAQPQQAGY